MVVGSLPQCSMMGFPATEVEVPDRPMTDSEDNIARHLSVIWRYLIMYAARNLEHLGIGSGQYPYLLALYEEDGQSQQSLSDRLLVDKSATVGAINKLEALGYVDRRTDENDKRYYRIFLTALGWKIKPELQAIVGGALESLLTGLSDDERATALELTRRMAANILQATRGNP